MLVNCLQIGNGMLLLHPAARTEGNQELLLGLLDIMFGVLFARAPMSEFGLQKTKCGLSWNKNRIEKYMNHEGRQKELEDRTILETEEEIP